MQGGDDLLTEIEDRDVPFQVRLDQQVGQRVVAANASSGASPFEAIRLETRAEYDDDLLRACCTASLARWLSPSVRLLLGELDILYSASVEELDEQHRAVRDGRSGLVLRIGGSYVTLV